MTAMNDIMMVVWPNCATTTSNGADRLQTWVTRHENQSNSEINYYYVTGVNNTARQPDSKHIIIVQVTENWHVVDFHYTQKW